LKKVI